MPSRLLSLIALLCLTTLLHAQSKAPTGYQLYGGYSFLSNSLNGVPGSHQPLNGFDAGVGFPSWHSLRFKIDFAAYSGTNLGAPQHPYYIMGGGQYTWHIRREGIFVEGLTGDAGANKTWAANGAIGESASFTTLLGGGLDTPIARHILFRVNGGYQYSYFALQKPVSLIPYRIPGIPINFARLSTAVVWQF